MVWKSEVSRTKPALWEKVKQQVLRGSKGGPPGKWSARKAQLSVKLYKSKGGSYRGKKSSRNSLTKWSREDWGYISKSKKKKYGRYLPRKVRESLSPGEKRSENRKKGSKSGKWIPYGKKVLSLMRKHRITSSKGKRTSCWKGYHRVAGKKPGSKGSCKRN
jgi:hypothetical protein